MGGHTCDQKKTIPRRLRAQQHRGVSIYHLQCTRAATNWHCNEAGAEAAPHRTRYTPGARQIARFRPSRPIAGLNDSIISSGAATIARDRHLRSGCDIFPFPALRAGVGGGGTDMYDGA